MTIYNTRCYIMLSVANKTIMQSVAKLLSVVMLRGFMLSIGTIFQATSDDEI